MKTIGLIGGMSWESSLEYYRIINERIKAKLGGLHSAVSLMYSFDFEEIEFLQQRGDWDELARLMTEAAKRLEAGGADLLVICTNTMHKTAPAIESSVDIPLLHIADATAEVIVERGIRTIGLLGTSYTMEQDFYKGRLADQHGLKVLIPGTEGRRMVHDIIYQELCLGIINDSSRACYREIMGELVWMGAEGIILGCTEIGLLVGERDGRVPLFDTTRIHAEAAVDLALS